MRSIHGQVRPYLRYCLIIASVALFLIAQSIYPYTFRHLLHQASSDGFHFTLLRNTSAFNISFAIDRIYHQNGVAFDYYSQLDLNLTQAPPQWSIWPLTNETHNHSSVLLPSLSPSFVSTLPFVDRIYLMTDLSLTERHDQFENALRRQGISLASVQWRFKWNRTTCNDPSNHAHVYQRLNLNDKPLDDAQQRKCPLAMKHADVWYEMAERKVPLGLILEDDAIFVPFFKEKLTRMISAALRSGALRLNGTCAESKGKKIADDEWINQNPMFVIGSCYYYHGSTFEKSSSRARPVLTTHKSNPSRCTHAYLLTSCSAQALVDQIQAKQSDFWPSDFMQNHLFPASPTLQSFWMDPPLVYQGNQVTDLDNVNTFTKQTY